MLSYSVKVLRTLRLKNRIIVNVLVRCELYVYICTKIHISQLYRTEVRQEKEISYNNGSNPAPMVHHGVSATEPLIPNFSLSCGRLIPFPHAPHPSYSCGLANLQ